MTQAQPPKRSHSSYCWSNLSEMQFIDRLGLNNNRTAYSRIRCLQGYLAGLKLRRDWGNMDPLIIIDYARQALKKAQREKWSM